MASSRFPSKIFPASVPEFFPFCVDMETIRIILISQYDSIVSHHRTPDILSIPKNTHMNQWVKSRRIWAEDPQKYRST